MKEGGEGKGGEMLKPPGREQVHGHTKSLRWLLPIAVKNQPQGDKN